MARGYRPPEAVLTPGECTLAVDIWFTGCTFAEMLSGKPLFQGWNHDRLLTKILNVLGNQDYMWIRSEDSRNAIMSNYKPERKVPLMDKVPKASTSALDLLKKLLQFDPTKRIRAEEALRHEYLREYHNPENEPSAAPLPESSVNFESIEDMEKLKKAMYEEIMSYFPSSSTTGRA
ncbi:hypothetical protein V499_05587 [Pseudogymnoascus sp. VKM F-103]|uniref:MAP kinase Pmk1 n=1 Tax=Pseudogymnoascus verrucosus TaxID=342668 RepID=A0A1B8GLK7_9PEZI|nr:MAP kinase Pmk1 [Pseudogymnoascus verrucosus]KFY74388.1 hypothetical protein V499_05587 [Pseudogymnoascus sp. VKM F-103]OBT96721.2 MAP kinase Pmk1 [Pseudogymnoascus verrucosus]